MFLPIAHADGVIEDAPRISTVLLNAFEFLLSIVGIIGIVGLVFAGLLYFFAGGNQRMVETAKKATVGSVTGLAVVFGAWVIVKTLLGFFA
jgi:hypothetical protein